MKRVLLLGGTAEARRLAQLLADEVDLTVSLSGATRTPAHQAGRLRTGGFGGVAGLCTALGAFDALVDATHPFATRISANAAEAARLTGCPLLVVRRPLWTQTDGATWQGYSDLSAALSALPPDAHPFLATGAGTGQVLAAYPDIQAVLRSIEPVEDLPKGIFLVRDRPPFTQEAEIRTFRRHAITHLVTRNSGGERPAKVDAATHLNLPIMMIEPPASPSCGDIVTDVKRAHARLRRILALDTRSNAAS